MRSRRLLAAGPGLAFLLLAAGPARAAGFEVNEQGAKAMGLAGAFAAQADDPSAIFYNPAGLAFQGKGITAGTGVLALNESQYQGLPPGLGAGSTGEQEDSLSFPAHAYVVKPLSPRVKLGVGLYSPFLLKTRWAEPDAFPGRTASLAAEIRAYDLVTTFGWQAAPGLGLGVGGIYRTSDFTQERRLQRFAPFAGREVDYATLAVETDPSFGAGWTLGLLHRAGRFSWGLSYRSAIEIDYEGAGRPTQVPTGNAQFDEITATIPFLGQDLPAATAIAFPDAATLGLAFAATGKLVFELDVTRTGWSGFEGISVAFPTHPDLDDAVQGPWEDALSYRLGLALGPPKGPQWRFGVALEETPQPDASVGPFLPDGARAVVAAGFGLDWLDLAFQWATSSRRTTFTSSEGLNGNYEGSSYLLGISISKK